jgi:teichuronic acid biosynthesis glycosyltransferase TuaG
MRATVFTSSYNHGAFLPAAIESVQAQTVEDWDYLLMDDGSEDATWDIMQAYAARDARIVAHALPKQDNVGVVINQSVREATGDLWAWLPADDTWRPTLLERKLQAAEEFPGAVIYSHGQIMGGDAVTPADISPRAFRELVQTKSPIGMTGIVIPLDILRAIPFPEHLGYSEDFWWMLTAVKAGVEFRCVPEILYEKRQHANSISGRHEDDIAANVRTIREEVSRCAGS